MATWDVEDLVKEISDMEAIYQRNAGSQLVPRMQEALQSKVNGVQCSLLLTSWSVLMLFKMASWLLTRRQSCKHFSNQGQPLQSKGPPGCRLHLKAWPRLGTTCPKANGSRCRMASTQLMLPTCWSKESKCVGWKASKKTPRSTWHPFWSAFRWNHQCLASSFWNVQILCWIRSRLWWLNLCMLVWQGTHLAPTTLGRHWVCKIFGDGCFQADNFEVKI